MLLRTLLAACINNAAKQSFVLRRREVAECLALACTIFLSFPLAQVPFVGSVSLVVASGRFCVRRQSRVMLLDWERGVVTAGWPRGRARLLAVLRCSEFSDGSSVVGVYPRG